MILTKSEQAKKRCSFGFKSCLGSPIHHFPKPLRSQPFGQMYHFLLALENINTVLLISSNLSGCEKIMIYTKNIYMGKLPKVTFPTNLIAKHQTWRKEARC
uniref:Uncharacterized protein n=1 Tax=Sphaerodactylus townsendi TaxID=933632 RepID=A0ACB8GEI5_9SAUR